MYRKALLKIFLLTILICASQIRAIGQRKPAAILELTESPTNYQVYQRDNVDKCTVTIKGKLFSSGPLILARKSRYKYITNFYPISSLPITLNADSTFEVEVRIPAELREWTFELYHRGQRIVSFENLVCGDVYAVLGQSNATSDLGGPDAEYVMDGYTFNKDYADRYARAVGQGLWGLEAAKESYLWKGWGPAGSIFYDLHHSGGWPLKLQHNIIKNNRIPVGVINAAMSGSSINQHFKNSPPVQILIDADGTIIHKNPEGYNLRQYLLSKLKRAGALHSLKYILWYQGESDGTTSPCKSHYADLLNSLIAEWVQDMPSLQKVFVFQLNTSCLEEAGRGAYAIREAQRQVCISNPMAELIPTSGLSVWQMSNDEVHFNTYNNNPCHYNRLGMEFLANRIHKSLSGLIYKTLDSTSKEVLPNEIKKASLNRKSNQLTLEFTFDIELIDTNDAGQSVSLKDYFFDQDYDPVKISKLVIDHNKLTLHLEDTIRLEKISIYPSAYYNHNKRIYYGPWLSTKDSDLGLPFFADVPVEQGADENPVFMRNWNNLGGGNLGDWNLNSKDLVVSGHFIETVNPEVLLIDKNGKSRLMEFDGHNWQTHFSTTLPQNLTKVWAGDFTGNGRDEILTLGMGLGLYSFDSTGQQQLSHSEPYMQELVKKSSILSGDFDGDGQEDILFIDQANRQVKLYGYTVRNNRYHLSEKLSSLTAPAVLFDYNNSFYSGDFNGDGYDEVLAFGNGAVLSTIKNGQWQWLWSASLYDHFKGWNYPLDIDNLSLLIGELDTNHKGDELMIIGSNHQETGISIYGFNETTKSWSENETHLSKDPYLGDWPLKSDKGRNTAYHLISEGNKPARLLTMREFECGDNWRYEAALYSLRLNLVPTPGDSQAKNKSFYIYPNPASSLLHVESANQATPPTSVRVYTQNGQLIHHHSESFAPNNFLVDVSRFNPGIYFIEIQSETAVETHKFVIVD